MMDKETRKILSEATESVRPDTSNELIYEDSRYRNEKPTTRASRNYCMGCGKIDASCPHWLFFERKEYFTCESCKTKRKSDE